MKDQFLLTLENELYAFDPNFKKSTLSFQLDEVITGEVTTYYYKDRNLMVDVVDQECCLTAKDKNIVFAFYDDDYLDVINDVLIEIRKLDTVIF